MSKKEQVEMESEVDQIDQALGEVLDAALGEEPTEEQIELISNIMFAMIEDMEDAGEIEPLPEEDVSEDEKQRWIDANLATLKSAVVEASRE